MLINILIVDDEPKNLTVLESVLDDPGYRLVRAESGESALRALVAEEFALLILDISMPGMTGFELAQIVKTRRKTALVPIIFLTAHYNEDHDALEGYASGAVDFLHKPVNARVLRSKVAVFAALHRQGRALEAANLALLAEVGRRKLVEARLLELNDSLDRQIVERTEALRASQEDLQLALEAAAMGTFDSDLLRNRTTWSPWLEAFWGYAPGEFDGNRAAVIARVHPDDLGGLEAEVARASAAREPLACDYRVVRPDASIRWAAIRGRLEFDAQGQAIRLRGVVRDISTRRAAELQLRHQESMLAQADTLAGLGRWDWNLAADGASWSDGLYRIYGRDPANGVPAFDDWQETIHPEDEARLAHCIQTALAGASAYHVEFRIFTKDTGQLRYVESRGSSVVDANGKPTNIRGFDLDITERKLAENALQAALKEKTALLNEVHHRVKNNLQVVTSLLRLESRRSAVLETVDVLKAMQARIHTMALLHESLYRSGTFASVDLGVYLGQIATQAFQAQVLDDKRVRLRLTMGSVSVGMDQAIAGGLLVNELVSNCLKHGFAGARSGEVHVDLQPEDAAAAPTEARWRLRVRDTGVGLPPGFEDKRKTSLGLILAEDLSQQVGGILTIQSQPGTGTEFSVVFRALEPAALVMPV